MEDAYAEMIAVSRQIASSFPAPRFYGCCRPWIDLSRALFSQEEKVGQCRAFIRERLRSNYGHGLDHAEKVAVEAGALTLIEGDRSFSGEADRRQAGRLAQMAGLLHDLRRGEKDHARSSAAAAEKVLRECSFHGEEIEVVRGAIANHEAFVEPRRAGSVLGQVVSDALYDADKFRWGPDNFTLTLWEMLRSSRTPLIRMVERFPKGMKGIARIKDTFRSPTGKTYGPEFIDLGLKIGEKIHQYLRERFGEELARQGKGPPAPG